MPNMLCVNSYGLKVYLQTLNMNEWMKILQVYFIYSWWINDFTFCSLKIYLVISLIRPLRVSNLINRQSNLTNTYQAWLDQLDGTYNCFIEYIQPNVSLLPSSVKIRNPLSSRTTKCDCARHQYDLYVAEACIVRLIVARVKECHTFVTLMLVLSFVRYSFVK